MANSPARTPASLLVSGTIGKSCDACSPLTRTAGRTFVAVKSENGYRTSTTSLLEKLGIDIVLRIIPYAVERRLTCGKPKCLVFRRKQRHKYCRTFGQINWLRGLDFSFMHRGIDRV